MGHTPSPWDVQNKGDLHKKSARVEVVQGIVVLGVNQDVPKLLPTIVKMPDLSERSYANARLIAAAPELLSICEQARRIFGGHNGSPADPKTNIEIEQGYNVLSRMAALIAKAQG